MSTVSIDMERAARAGLIKLEIDRLVYEAERPEATVARLETIRREIEVLVESLREIRREQLRDQIVPPAARSPRRRWWRRARG